jgi:hypothetical protein
MKSKKAERTLEEKKKALRDAIEKAELAGADLEELAGKEQEACSPGLPPDRQKNSGT